MSLIPSAEMTPRQMQSIRTSWRNFRDVDPMIFSETLSAKLITDHPVVNKVFRREVQEHFIFFHQMMNLLVARIDRPEEAEHLIEIIARRNERIGITAVQLDWIQNAFLWTLEKGTGPEWTTEIQKAWILYYNFLVSKVKNVQYR